jgi:hypothetical protein
VPKGAGGVRGRHCRVPQVALFYLGVGIMASGISSCLQMARTVPSLISRWRGAAGGEVKKIALREQIAGCKWEKGTG